MTFDELEVFIDRITYKPGFSMIALRSSSDGYVSIRMSMMVPDALSKTPLNRLLPISTVKQIPEYSLAAITEEHLLHILKHTILSLERHEMDEFLRLDGACVTDPHPEFKNKRLTDF